MVALYLHRHDPEPTLEQMELIYKEALEHKRNQIAHQQQRPPFDPDENRLINSAMARLHALLARSGSAPVSETQWNRSQADDTASPGEMELFTTLAEHYGISPTNARPESPGTRSGPRATQGAMTCLKKLPIAPRLVVNTLENAGLSNTPENRRIAFSTMASAYQAAFEEANRDLDSGTGAGQVHYLPEAMRAALGANGRLTSADGAQDQHCAHFAKDTASVATGRAEAPTLQSTPPMATNGLLDLKISELMKHAIDINKSSGAWQLSAQRNARAIADIFVAVNGDLRMSEIHTRHLIELRDRLDRMPTVWGKSAEDRKGGFPAIFARGDKLAKQWKEDVVEAKSNGLETVGFAVPTYNRHILTLKQLFDFAANQRDGHGNRTHISPSASFNGMVRKDKRRKNTRKPLPTSDEVRTLLRSPLHTGCAGRDSRFKPGNIVIHDAAYWVPLLLVIYGPRSNEFCKLPLAHVHDAAPMPFFRIAEWEGQTLKTAATSRDLPIAPNLIKLGFLKYVRELRQRGEFFLFPELNLTKEEPRKVFLEDVFRPLVNSQFPDGTSVRTDDKDIDTQSMRKFVTNFLLGADPKIELRIRQAFVGHERSTTIESTYDADPSLEELMTCVLRTQVMIDHLTQFPIRIRRLNPVPG